MIKEFAKMIKWSVIMLLLLSCEKDNEEVFPVEPHIEFTNIVFNEPKVFLPSPDTLELSFSYTDGDADLGLDYDNPVHNAFPYHQFYYYLKTTGEKISSDKLERGEVLASQLIRLEDRAYPPFDTLPELGFGSDRPYDLVNYDYIYKTDNEKHLNLFIDFLIEDENGVFINLQETIDYWFFNSGRFPTPNADGSHPFKTKRISSKRGVITFYMVNYGFRVLFNKKKIKLRFSIVDRAFHSSNIIETPEFYLEDIQ